MSAMHRILFCRSCGNSFVPHIKTSQILSQRLSTQAATRKQSPQSAYTPIWQHQPVLFDKTLRALGILDSQLEPNRPRVIVDATFGNGGHTGGILAHDKSAQVIAIDCDQVATAPHVDRMKKAYGDRFQFIHGRFGQLTDILESVGVREVDAVLFDVGTSSMQLEDPARGFSFRLNGPLDMRMDTRSDITARDLVNNLPYDQLKSLFIRLGDIDPPTAKKLAMSIIHAREKEPIASTARLSALVCAAHRMLDIQNKVLHPATRAFQALRIIVNNEMQELQDGLDAAVRALKPKGRLATITFHSKEHRIVERFANAAMETGPDGPPLLEYAIRRTPWTPSGAEVSANRRARSARLRALQRTDAPYRNVMPETGPMG